MLQKQAKSRKEQIALTAIDIISEGGTQNLSMMKIAERIGVTDAALYKHFINSFSSISLTGSVYRLNTSFLAKIVALS